MAPRTRKSRYRSTLRAEQSAGTRAKIQRAAAGLLDGSHAAESITFKAVAARAGVTEMTVYRHFPTRKALLEGLWQYLNEQMDPAVGMPDSLAGLLAQHAALFAGFDHLAPRIVASISTPQGRAMRAALNRQRRKSFMAIVASAAPDLPAADRTRVAAIVQLLHSAYAWASLREQWNMSGEEAGRATRWAIESLLKNPGRKP